LSSTFELSTTLQKIDAYKRFSKNKSQAEKLKQLPPQQKHSQATSTTTIFQP